MQRTRREDERVKSSDGAPRPEVIVVLHGVDEAGCEQLIEDVDGQAGEAV